MQHTQPILFADSKASYDTVAKNGYYQVGKQFFNHKITALVEATKNNQPVQWHFHDQVWKDFDWRYNDSLSLDHWYKERAKQLREKYDYLILAFSGGRDSQNVLRSFVDNNIHLDEVWSDWPLSHTHGKFDQNSQNKSSTNMPGEWTFAIRPELDWLAKTHPAVKITITDSTQHLDDEDKEDSLLVTPYAFYATIKRWKTVDGIIQQRNKKHNRVAVIVAHEKPRYDIVNDYMSIYFSDQNFQLKSDNLADGIRNVEYFYWTPDLPELVRCQAHTILGHLRVNKNAQLIQKYGFIDKTNKICFEKNTLYPAALRLDLTNSLIYPKWDSSKLQVNKPDGSISYNEYYTWLYVHKNLRCLQSHRSMLNNTFKLVDDKFLDKDSQGNVLNYAGITTKYFPVGKLNRISETGHQ
jgi:hypothetical protein